MAARHRDDLDVEALQAEFLPQGCLVFSSDGTKQLTVLASTDPLDAVAVRQTNGINYDVGPGDIISWLRKLQSREPFVLTCVTRDSLKGRFRGPVQDPQRLAEETWAICPGDESLQAMAERYARSGQFFLWWD